MRDKYFISLHLILENFVNFLQRNDGKGNIIIESRNPTQDEQLQKHLGTVSFPVKQENIIGLQIADLIPNPLNRDLSEMPQKQDGLLELIKQKAYHGDDTIQQEKRFGIKVIP